MFQVQHLPKLYVTTSKPDGNSISSGKNGNQLITARVFLISFFRRFSITLYRFV